MDEHKKNANNKKSTEFADELNNMDSKNNKSGSASTSSNTSNNTTDCR